MLNRRLSRSTSIEVNSKPLGTAALTGRWLCLAPKTEECPWLPLLVASSPVALEQIHWIGVALPDACPARICSFTSVFRILQFFPHLHVEKESSGWKNFLSLSFHHWGNPPIWTVASGSPYSWGGWSLDSSSPSPTPNLCKKTFDLTSFPLCYAMCSPYPSSGNSVIQTEHTHTTDETAITTPYSLRKELWNQISAE